MRQRRITGHAVLRETEQLVKGEMRLLLMKGSRALWRKPIDEFA